MTSFIVPAHNEELWIGSCLNSIHTAMETIAEPYEVIVVDDASTDSTLEIARQSARVISVDHRKISAVRNEGARAASGETLFFVDADTKANADNVHEKRTLRLVGFPNTCIPVKTSNSSML